MRRLILAAAISVGALTLGAAAQAMPAMQAPAADAGIINVAQGCGPGGHRDGVGRCVPSYRRPMHRACPPGMHLARFGRCRPNL